MAKDKRGHGFIYQHGRTWWMQFYQDGQRVRMSTGATDEAVPKRILREHVARVTLKEPIVARAARVTYGELRKDLVEHYTATGSRDLTEAGSYAGRCQYGPWLAPFSLRH